MTSLGRSTEGFPTCYYMHLIWDFLLEVDFCTCCLNKCDTCHKKSLVFTKIPPMLIEYAARFDRFFLRGFT